MEVDFESGGFLAARILDQMIRGTVPERRVHTYGGGTLISRHSTRLLPEDARVRTAMRFLDQHAFDLGLKIDTVAQAMKCSRRMADLVFRAATGHTILDEIQSRRIEQAKRLLANPLQAIDPISNFCGYHTPAMLKRLFRKHTGTTMRNWRKRYAGM